MNGSVNEGTKGEQLQQVDNEKVDSFLQSFTIVGTLEEIVDYLGIHYTTYYRQQGRSEGSME